MDKESLFTPQLDEADVVLPRGRGVVRVRALLHDELVGHRSRRDAEGKSIDWTLPENQELSMRIVLSYAMVDPVLTEEEVGKWRKAALGAELNMVIEKVNELSGLTEAAAKSDIPGIHD